MGVRKNRGGDTVCPLCLMTEKYCETLQFVNAMKWDATTTGGVTKSRALSLRHPPICHTCRFVFKRCWTKRKVKIGCFLREKAAQDHYPDWFRVTELTTDDQRIFTHDK